MGKLLQQKLAWEAVIESELQDLWNKFHAFKRQMLNVCRKYDTNFQKVEASESLAYCSFVAHEAVISLINQCCTCGKDDKTVSLSYGTPVSSPSPVGMPILLEPVPLQVVPEFHVGNTVFPPFGKVNGVSFIVVASSGRGSSFKQFRGVRSMWPEGCSLISFDSQVDGWKACSAPKVDPIWWI